MGTVVVGVTDTPTAEDAARQAADLAHQLGMSLHLVSAANPRYVRPAETGEVFSFGTVDEADKHHSKMVQRLRSDIDVTTSVVVDKPAKALCEEAARLDADIIVVGSVGTQGVSRLRGSVANEVIKRAPCAVFVAQTA